MPYLIFISGIVFSLSGNKITSYNFSIISQKFHVLLSTHLHFCHYYLYRSDNKQLTCIQLHQMLKAIQKYIHLPSRDTKVTGHLRMMVWTTLRKKEIVHIV